MGPTRLVRVRWDGKQVGDSIYDPRSRITATLEFDRSMKGAFRVMTSTDWASLVPEKAGKVGTTRTEPDTVKPLVKRLSSDDPSTVILQFPGNSLARGWCHRLRFEGGFASTTDFD